MTIEISNKVNGEVYSMQPARGQSRQAFKALWHHAREVDAYDRTDCRAIRSIMGDSPDGRELPTRKLEIRVEA